jgi:hypothetical protein
VADGFGQVWRELVRAEDFDILAGKSSLQAIGSVPSQAVVAAHRISVGDDHDSGHGVEFIS